MRLLGRRTREVPDVDDTCLQCGRPGTDLLEADARRVRQSCRVCGAVLTTPTSRRLRTAPDPAATGQASAASEPGPVPGADAQDGAGPLAAYLPPDMLAWVREHHGPDLPDAPDKAVMTAWHTGYDEFTARTAGDGDPRPPKFGKVVGALNAACFDVDLALERLVPKSGGAEAGGGAGRPDGGGAERELARERAEYLLRWIAGPGRSDSWIAARATVGANPAGGSPAGGAPSGEGPDAAEVEAALALPSLTDALRSDGGRTLRLALFGVRKGPALGDVVEHFGEESVRDALRAYAADGSRPLLDTLTARLDAAR
ncbi:hypothetical protein DZF91_32180 [Actinomadura logoneensis]|uniref:Uncharacterized protein n=1 Tax=Actinomadura logoneensis TaxID=2293572 RepID=A0A372JC72_9ACTN|nr:hypothetical protein [Actinomadura logoneensis]RFU37572.1 hypothetical protein DZF91_32180 [Actinomadura logoneensis]